MPKSVRVSEAPQANLDALFEKKGGARALTPEQQLYGIYGPQYAALLGRDKHGSTENASDKAILAQQSELEQTRYDAALAAANAAQQQIAVTEGQTDTRGKIITTLPSYAEHGMAGALARSGPEYGIFGDPGSQAIIGNADRSQLNLDEATRKSDTANALGTLATAGVMPSPQDVSGIMTNPAQATPDNYGVYQTPADKTKAYGQDQGKTVDQQMEIARIQAEATVAAARARGDDLKVTHTVTDDGKVVDTRYEGSPAALAAAGIGPDGHKINPKAGANSGNAPAQPAAVPALPPHITGAPTSRFFSQGHITSPEGNRKDPFTGVIKHHDGVDYAGYKRGTPIPAEQDGIVTFSGQISGYGNATKIKYNDGSTVLYGHSDKLIAPVGTQLKAGQEFATVGSTGRSTGPHVHRKVEVAANMSPSTIHIMRLKQLPNVLDAQDGGHGRILVTLKTLDADGKNQHRVVSAEGKVIG